MIAWVQTSDGRRFLHIRAVGGHQVADLMRTPKQPALVVCIKCGVTWSEGADDVPVCRDAD